MRSAALPGLCLHLANYLVSFSHLTCPRTLPNIHVQLFAKMDPTAEAYGCMSTLIMGWRPIPFCSPRSLPVRVQTGKFSLTSGVVILSLYSSRAQLLPLPLSLECLGENKASILLHLTNTRCPAQGPIYLLPHREEKQILTSLGTSQPNQTS